MTILLLGSQGQLGCCLRDQIEKANIAATYSSRESLDICDLRLTSEYLHFLRPKVVINTAAYTKVDAAEKEPEMADLLNHRAVANIADTCSKLGIWLIHLSTNYVFDGQVSRPYDEEYPTAAQSIYAASKLDGEISIQRSKVKHLIIRTSWVYSEHGSNFLKTMLNLAKQREPLRLVKDQIGCPTYAQDLSIAILTCVSRLENGVGLTGCYHYCGDHSVNWLNFAEAIFSEARAYGWDVPEYLEGIKASEFGAAAARPTYGVLDCGKFEATFNILPSDFKRGISSTLKALHESSL